VQQSLVLKNIIFGRGPNRALQRFWVHSHNHPLHWVNFSVNLYFRFSFFNVDFNLLLLCHLQGSNAFPFHSMELSSLTNRKYISTLSLQRFIHLLPHTSCQHSHVSQTKAAYTYNKYFFYTSSVLNKKMKYINNKTLVRNNTHFSSEEK
jgi:hypothetical protein